MADQLQLRGGTTSEHSTFTGALREVTVDIDKDTLVVHDNTTAGGHPLAKENLSNVSGATAASKLANQTVAFNLGAAATPSVTFNGDTNTGIYSPGADQLALSTGGFGRLFVTSGGSVGINTSSVVSVGTNIVPLEIKGTATNRSGALVLSTSDNSQQAWQYFASDVYYTGTSTNHDVLFLRNGTERMRLTSTGLGIGTSSPFVQLTNVSSNGGLVSSNSTGFAWQSTANDWAGAISSRPSSGNSYALRAHTEGTTASDYILFASSGSGTGTARLAVTGAGNVGIGTASPGTYAQLAVFGAVSNFGQNISGIFYNPNGPSSTITIQDNTSASGGGIGSVGNNLVLYSNSGANLAERARIDSNGRLLVGTSTNLKSEKLGVTDSGGNPVAVFQTTFGAAAQPLLLWNTSTTGDNKFAEFYTEGGGGTVRGSITYSRGGGVTAYNTTSDYRAKTIIGPLVDTGSTIDAFRVYKGVMNGATIERPMLIAHEAQEVAPYCVTGDKDAVDKDGNPVYQQMDHQVLVPLLIAEIQQLRARVAALESA